MSERNRLYNLLHTGNPGDVTYYRSCCHRGESVLELGCGSGRIARALSEKGCDAMGIDNDPEMIAVFKKEAAALLSPPVVIPADMREFSLQRRFDKIIIPFNGLLCMLTETDVVQTLRQAANHLNDEGELIFDMYYVPADFQNVGEEEESYINTAVLDDNGTPIHVYEKTLVGEDPQRFDTSYYFVTHPHCADEQQFEMTILQRCIYVEQLSRVLAQAGMSPKAVHADFVSGKAVDDNTEQVVVHAVKAPH